MPTDAITIAVPDVPPLEPEVLAPPTMAAIPQVVAPRLQAEAAAHQQEMNREQSSAIDSIKAAASEWATMDAYRYLTGVDYEPEEYDFAGRMNEIDFMLTPDESDFLRSRRPVSNAEFDDRLARIKEQRANYQRIGDHPVLAGVTAVADPIMWGITIGSAGLGGLARTAQVGRLVAGASEASATAALGYAQTQAAPTSMSEIATNAMLGAAGAQMLYRGGRWVKAVEDYPDAEIRKVLADAPPPLKPTSAAKWVQRVDENGAPVLRDGKPVYVREAVVEAVDVTPRRTAQVNTVVDETAQMAPPRHAFDNQPFVGAASRAKYVPEAATAALRGLAASADPTVAALARHLAEKAGPLLDTVGLVRLAPEDLAAKGGEFRAGSNRAREHYSPGDNTVYVATNTPDDVVLHELAHGATVAKIAHGLQNPTSVHGVLVRELEGLRQAAAAKAKELEQWSVGGQHANREYLTKNVSEFVAGLYSGDTPFLRMLAAMKTEGKPSILSRAFDTVRRLLGLSAGSDSALAKAMSIADDLLESPYIQGMEKFHAQYPGLSKLDGASPQVKAYAQNLDSSAKALGQRLGWNAHKTMARWNKRVADLLMDDPLNPAGNSVESQRRAIRADLAAAQYKYEDLLKETMAAEGAGTMNRVLRPGQSLKTQARIEKEVALEMLARDQARWSGKVHTSTAPKHIQALADALDEVAEVSLAEMKRAGVAGADAVDFRSGYFTRRWNPAAIEDAVQRFAAHGIDAAGARGQIVSMMAGAARRANGWSNELARDVAGAIYDRTVRKGNMSDSAFRGHIGNEAAAEVRDILTKSGLSAGRIQRALDVLTGVVDEAGKAPVLKSRVDMDMRSTMRLPDGTTLRLSDMLDTNLTKITDQYLDGVASRSAYARAGLGTPSEIGALRTELIDSITDFAERKEAAELFDNIVKFQQGLPAGEDLPRMMRLMSDVTQTVGLASSGLWQVTEFSTIMQRFGLGKTLQYTLKELPIFRQVFDDIKARASATHLKTVLERNSAQDIRLRPYIMRMEDNFEYNVTDTVQAALKSSKQWVPYINAMRYVHHHQAAVSANLIVDLVDQAAKGNAKALEHLAQYGLDSHIMARVGPEIAQHGHDVAAWADEAWDAVRGPLTKMMDEAVLRSRVGEIPAFAQFSSTGKFIFTFRSFVLAAHNKLLAGTLNRGGYAGLTLLMLYQYPLALAAVQAQNTIAGKPAMDDKTLLARTLSQFGSLGLASELVGLVSGEKQQFGAPGFIALDRLWKLSSHVAQGKFGNAGADLLNTLPILPLVPGIKALGESLK